jgi:hypothetical protein
MDDIKESVAFLDPWRDLRPTNSARPPSTNTTPSKDFEAYRPSGSKGAKRYYIQRYIDSENCISHGLAHAAAKEKALEAKAIIWTNTSNRLLCAVTIELF